MSSPTIPMPTPKHGEAESLGFSPRNIVILCGDVAVLPGTVSARIDSPYYQRGLDRTQNRPGDPEHLSRPGFVDHL